jgi:hypothetical protein
MTRDIVANFADGGLEIASTTIAIVAAPTISVGNRCGEVIGMSYFLHRNIV